MANVEKTVNIIFAGKDKVSKTIRSINKQMGQFGRGVETMAKPLAGVANGILKLDAAMATLAVGGIAYATKKYADFEDVMLKVKGIMGASQEEYGQLTALTKELGATTRYTATEASQGLEFLALAGFSVTEAIEALPNTLQLAQASALDLGEAADIVTNIMAGYGVAVKDLGKSNDILTATFTNSNTNLSELGQAFSYVGPVAKSFGLDMETTSAVIGTLANAGIKAEKGGTALRNILVALAAPTKNAGKLFKKLGVDTSELGVDLASSSKALESLGVKVKDAQGNMRYFPDILKDLQAGLEKIPSSADRTAILIEIFGKRGGPQLQALLNQGIDSVTDLESKIKSLGGVTQKIANEMESGMGGALRALNSAIESIFIGIGEKVKDGAIPAAQGVKAVFVAIQEQVNTGAFDSLFDELESFGVTVKEYFEAIAKALPEALEKIDFSGLLDALGELSGSFGDLFGDLDLTKPEDLATAIQGLIDTITAAINITDGMVEAFKPYVEALKEGVSRVNEMDSDTRTAFGNVLTAAQMVTRAGVAVAAAMAAIQQSGSDVKEVFDLVVGSIKAGFNALQVALDSASKMVLNFLDKMMSGLENLSALTLLPEKFNPLKQKIKEVRKEISLFKEAVDENRNNNFQEMVDGWNQAFGDTEKQVTKVGKAIKEELNEPFQIMIELDSGEMVEFADYSKETLKDGVTVTPKLEPESKKAFISDGKNMVEAVGNAAKETFYDVEKAGNKISLKFESAVKDIEKTAKEKKAVTTETISEVEAKYKALGEYVRSDAEKTKQAFDSLEKSFSSSGQTLADLYSNLDDVTGSDKLALKKSIEKESVMRREQHEKQQQILDLQVKLYEAQVKRLGDDAEPAISITADGLEPELEAFMFKILERVQTRVNQQYGQMLLGVS